MSRIGKKPIQIPTGVTVTLTPQHQVVVKGPKGQLSQALPAALTLSQSDNQLTLVDPTPDAQHAALHGLHRNLIFNMVQGVTTGFQKELTLIGVGYKAKAQKNVLDIEVGYSHNTVFVLPPEITVTTAQKGKNPTILLQGIDKQLVGQVAAKIRAERKPEPYKGKGIRYTNEHVRKKQGKTTSK